MTIAIVILAIGLLIWLMKTTADTAKMQKEQDAAFAASHQGWDIYVSPYGRTALAINRQSAQIALGPVSSTKQYHLRDVAQIEVLKDGASITSTNRGSQMAGAAVGGFLLGGVGLLLGGLSGSKTTRTTVQSISLKIIVDDRQAPVHEICFFRSADGKGTDPKSFVVTAATQKVEHFHALLVGALRVQATTPSLPNQPQRKSLSEHLRDLWDLKQAGALTEEEFTLQKARLLAAAERQRARKLASS